MTESRPTGGSARVTRLSRLSLRRRLALMMAIGFGLAAAGGALVAFLVVRTLLLNDVDDTLLRRAQAAVDSPLANPSTLARIPTEALGAGDVRLALQFADGTAVSSEGTASAPPLGAPELAVARGEAPTSVRSARTSGENFRVVAVPAADGVALVLARPTAATDRILTTLALASALTAMAGVAIGAMAGSRLARAGLRPVAELSVAAQNVAATGRLDPIQVPEHAADDEIARLAESFNAMLSALAQARVRERQLIADAGHELRTPLTSLRTNIDLLIQTEGGHLLDDDDRRALLEDVSAQALDLSALVSDLVELARDDPAGHALTELDLADVVHASVQRVARRAPGVAIQVSAQSWPILGDGPLLERAVTNLLDNAVKWSPPGGGQVAVTLANGVVTVTDNGPGIAAQDLPYVFDRFYRADEARALPGSGLGLAIVRQAASRHGGEVSAASPATGGAVLTLAIPASG